jgi:hypothetical protein
MLLPDGTQGMTKDFESIHGHLPEVGHFTSKNFETFTNRNCTEGLDFVGREYNFTHEELGLTPDVHCSQLLGR